MIRSRALSLLTAALLAAPQGALANPLGAQVPAGGGSAAVQGQGSALVTVTQSSNRAIINWNTFNIGAGETTRFIQPDASAIALNRVTGGLGASQIYGTISANGRVFLVNPYGILFGAGAQINTAGFLASTNDITDRHFMHGHYKFNKPGQPDASIVNLGNIHITPSTTGFAALVAPGVRNAGTITANLGHVALASGNGFTLDFYGDKLITLKVGDQVAAKVLDVSTGQPLDALVKNEGRLRANGGRVELTAAAARHVVDSVINNSGTIEANTVGTRNGMIVLGAATKSDGVPVQKVKIAGTMSASGRKTGQSGGTVVVTGEDIALTGATIKATGQAAGGTVLIGDKTASAVAMDSKSVIDVSSKSKGDGGKVIMLSGGLTSIAGLIRASGGPLGGNGGFVETSGQTVDFTGIRVDTSAPAGTTGKWLVDPTDLVINSDSAATLANALATTNVTLQTNADGSTVGPGFRDDEGHGDIIINASIAWSPTIGMTTLSLIAARDIQINQAITATKGGLTRPGPGQWVPNGRPEYLSQCVDKSLKRLKLEQIDLYQLHSPSAPFMHSPAFGEALQTLEKLKGQGKLRFYGIATEVPQDAPCCLSAPGISSVQIGFGLLDLRRLIARRQRQASRAPSLDRRRDQNQRCDQNELTHVKSPVCWRLLPDLKGD